MNRYEPYGGNPPSVRGNDTSEAAAESVRDIRGRLALQVLAYFGSCGEHGATCDQAEAALNMRHQTCSARVRELYLTGKLVKTEERRVTRSGRRAAVYVTTEHTKKEES